MKKIFSILSLLLLCSIATMAESKVEIAETANGTITSSLDGQTVTLTVTPATGYYIRKSDITVQKTVDPSSGVRRGGIPVASALTLDGNDPEALSSERTYTFDIPAGYNAYVTASFTTCTAITLGVSIENWTYGETAKTPSVTGNTGNAAVSYTYATKGSTDFSATMPSNAGDYTVKAVIPAIDIYTAGEATKDFTISQKALTITADAKTKVYGTEDPELTYQVEGLIEGESLTGALTRAEGEDVGKYAIMQGTLAASDNYSVTFTADTLTITAATLADIEAQGYSGTYDGKAHTITVSIPEGASIMYGTADGSYDKETAPSYTNAGESMVYYQVTKANYNSVRDSATVTISQKALTITADAKTKVYGTEDPELTYQVDGLIEGENLTGALTRAEGEEVGKYAITQGTLAASDNYSVTFIGDTLTITALPAVDMDAFVTIDGVVFYEVQDKQILESLVNTDMVLSADAAKCFKLDSETGLVFNQGPDVMFALLGLKKGDVLVFKFVGKMLADGQMLCKKTNAAPARRGGGDMVLESDVEYEVLKDCDVIITVALAESSATVSNITKTPVEQINAIKMVKGSQQTATGWYTIDGRKLDKQPAAKGIYIRDGRKIIIR